jgi:hypothetical protein
VLLAGAAAGESLHRAAIEAVRLDGLEDQADGSR